MPATYEETYQGTHQGTLVDYTELRVQRRRFPPTPVEEPAKRSSNVSLTLTIALVLGAIAIAAILAGRLHHSTVVGSSVAARVDGLSPDHMSTIPDIRNWTIATPSDLSLNFTEWLRAFGIDPATKIDLDAHGNGEPSSTAYLLVTQKSPDLKRVVWVADHHVVFDAVEKMQGIARVPSTGMSRIQWSETATPVETPEGEGLMLIRDYSAPNGVTVYFLKNGNLCSGVPRTLPNVDLR